MVSALVQLLIVALLNALGQLSFKLGSEAFESFGRVVSSPSVLLAHPLFFVGGALYGVSLLLYVNVLSRTPLSRAYPFMGLTYVVVVILSVVVLNESVDMRVILGVLLVFAGVSLIGIGLES